MTDILFDIIGTLGFACVVGAYGALQAGKLKAEALSYSLINLVGGTLLFTSLMWSWNLGSVLIEFFWIAISLYGVWRWMQKNPHKGKGAFFLRRFGRK